MTYEGVEYAPSLSPDGKQFVFGWRLGNPAAPGLYVRDVAGGAPRRLTSSGRTEISPKWSPDGRQIAFLRHSPAGPELMVLPAEGGVERKLAQLARRDPSIYELESITWTADGRKLAASDGNSDSEPFAIHLFSFSAGERQRLNAPPPKIFGDRQAAFSPDGRNVAFVRFATGAEGDVYVMPIGGEPRRLTQDNSLIRGVE